MSLFPIVPPITTHADGASLNEWLATNDLPILRAAAAQDPTATVYVEIPVEFDQPITCRSLTDTEAAAVARLFKKWSDKT